MKPVLLWGQSGYGEALLEEIRFRLGDETPAPVPSASGPGWHLLETTAEAGRVFADMAFPHWVLTEIREVTGSGVNQLAAGLLDGFLEAFQEIRVEEPWPLEILCAAEEEGLARRAASVRTELAARLKKRLSRVAKLGRPGPFPPGARPGWVMAFTGFDRVLAASRVISGGQRRMADDAAAPSRSYLKAEEAYHVLGDEPAPGQRVIDLGAAPGGWSYSAAKRGALVSAVDNGPLKGGAAAHPNITHLKADGFSFVPESGRCDWLFCDMVEDPYRVLRLLADWVAERRGARFVVNLKFGRADPVELLREVERFRAREAADWERFYVRHLFHDREEFTLVGSSGVS